MVQRQTGKLRRKHKDLAHLGRKTNKEQVNHKGREDKKTGRAKKNMKTTKIKQGITLVKNPQTTNDCSL